MKKINFPNPKYLTGEQLIKTKHQAMRFSMQEMPCINRRNMKMRENNSLRVIKWLKRKIKDQPVCTISETQCLWQIN